MESAMFYRATGKWQVWAALCGAVLVHIGAVALANRSTAAAVEVADVPADIIVVPLVDEPQPVDPVDPPPELAPPAPPTTESVFIDEHPTPPRVRERFHREPQRLVSATAAPTRMAMSSAKVLAINAPRPE